LEDFVYASDRLPGREQELVLTPGLGGLSDPAL
jgi:hypothetical protein